MAPRGGFEPPTRRLTASGRASLFGAWGSRSTGLSYLGAAGVWFSFAGFNFFPLLVVGGDCKGYYVRLPFLCCRLCLWWVVGIGRWLRLVSLLFSAGLLLFLAVTAYSLLPANLGVEVGEDVGVELDVGSGELVLRAPVTVTNLGFFEIGGLVVEVAAVNSSGVPVFRAESLPLSIPAFSVYRGEVVMRVNLTEVFVEWGSYHLFHSDTFAMNVTARCRYALGLFGVTLRVPNLSFPWAAPLEGFMVNLTGLEMEPLDEGAALNATVAVSHQGWLNVSGVPVLSELLHSNGSLIAAHQGLVDLAPGTQYYAANFTLSEAWRVYLATHNATLEVVCTPLPLGVEVGGVLWVDWGAPLADLQLAEPQRSPFNSTHSLFSQAFNVTNYAEDLWVLFQLQLFRGSQLLAVNSSLVYLPAGVQTGGELGVAVADSLLSSGDTLTLVLMAYLFTPPINLGSTTYHVA